MARLRAGELIPRACVRRHVDNDWMANVTKGLKKLRKRVKKLAAEVAELRSERTPAPTAEAASETAPTPKPAGSRTNRTTRPRTRRRPATTASS
jgi:hypothetical protein